MSGHCFCRQIAVKKPEFLGSSKDVQNVCAVTKEGITESITGLWIFALSTELITKCKLAAERDSDSSDKGRNTSNVSTAIRRAKT